MSLALEGVVTETTDDLAIVNRVRDLFGQARQAKRNRIETWQRSFRMVHNRAWGQLREAWMPSPQVSEIYPIVAALVGWMTDQRTALSVIPSMDPHSATSNFYSQLARDLETTLHSGWIVNATDGEVEKALWDAMIYGTGFFKTCWNDGLAGGLGDAQTVRVDPFRVYVDPNATTFDDANYVIEARTMSMQELERRWPGSARKLKGGTYEDNNVDRKQDVTDNNGRVPMSNPGGVSGAPPMWGRPNGRNRAGGNPADYFDDGVTVYEAWLRENNHVDDPNGDEYVEDSWRVVVVAGNEVLLNESAKDLWNHGRHPYTRYVLHDLGDFWGISLVEHLTPMQVCINRLLASLQSNAELIGNPVFMEDSRSGIQRTKITNRPGTRLTKAPGSEVGWLVPPEMPSMVSDLVKFYIGEMERVSGLSAMTRGATPTGRNSQQVLDAVQEASFVRVRLSLRNLERALRTVGELTASLVVENYTVPRLVAIVGPEGEKASLALKARHFLVPTENGAVPMEFQLWVQAGSSLPISRQARAAEADTLFALGALDVQGILEAHDYPNRDLIVQRVNAAQAAGMFEPPGQRQASRA